MTEIWEQRVSGRGAVQHGAATLFIAWRRDERGVWVMVGSFWSRSLAQLAPVKAGPSA